MCYAIPEKVVSIKEKTVIVEYFGEQKNAFNEFDKLKIADYVYAQGGYVIKTLPDKEARSILNVWKETFFELQDLDLKLSKLNLSDSKYNKKFLRILDKAVDGRKLTEPELLYLLNIDNTEELSLLYKSANFVRQKHLGKSCCVHSILEFSNFCNNKCHYCGISQFNKNLTRYKMSTNELCKSASIAINKYGFQALVLQSGESNQYNIDELVQIIKKIKQESPVLIFISIGEVGIENLRRLYTAGARGILLRFETSNKELYHKINPNQNFENRITHLKAASEMGYLIITGNLIGIPGQTDQDILNDIYLAKELNAEMYSFGPFIPHPDTPFANEEYGKSKKILSAFTSLPS